MRPRISYAILGHEHLQSMETLLCTHKVIMEPNTCLTLSSENDGWVSQRSEEAAIFGWTIIE